MCRSIARILCGKVITLLGRDGGRSGLGLIVVVVVVSVGRVAAVLVVVMSASVAVVSTVAVVLALVGARARARDGTEGTSEKLGAVDELLVEGKRLSADEDLVGLGVDLSVELGTADELTDPLLSVVELLRLLGSEETSVDAGVKFAVKFKDELTAVVEEVVLDQVQQGIAVEQLSAFGELSLSHFKVSLSVKRFNEFRDGIRILIGLLVDKLHNILREAALDNNRGDDHVAKQVRAGHLKDLPSLFVLIKLQQSLTRLRHIEENGQRPVEQPSTLLHRLGLRVVGREGRIRLTRNARR